MRKVAVLLISIFLTHQAFACDGESHVSYRSRSGGNGMTDKVTETKCAEKAKSTEEMKAMPNTNALKAEEAAPKTTKTRIYLSRSGGSSSAQYIETENTVK